METIIIQTESKSTGKLLIDLAKKLGSKANVLKKEAAEDYILGSLMEKQKTGKLVSKEEVMSQLE
ncbi:MAG: hypothetical protein IPP61_06480 [Cytophagaceae bacterium]|nr:hypothetical protein [Cytophagaceae bacterium]MBK9935543.1 hypothetical protein [Cytophagaceae bacterium]MBL0301986.1 hypothetical protein [Cytophagaceae bacterium]MBL0324811.1 hypothetical protein [Cytophagaceae bacterium]